MVQLAGACVELFGAGSLRVVQRTVYPRLFDSSLLDDGLQRDGRLSGEIAGVVSKWKDHFDREFSCIGSFLPDPTATPSIVCPRRICYHRLIYCPLDLQRAGSGGYCSLALPRHNSSVEVDDVTPCVATGCARSSGESGWLPPLLGETLPGTTGATDFTPAQSSNCLREVSGAKNMITMPSR